MFTDFLGSSLTAAIAVFECGFGLAKGLSNVFGSNSTTVEGTTNFVAAKSFLEIIESTSTSFPPIERADSGSSGVLQAALPMSLPETSCKYAYPPETRRIPSPSHVLCFLFEYFRLHNRVSEKSSEENEKPAYHKTL